ncbi:hypothetical protein MLD38_012642 [Melastoma candidum]|uniref:Uncharacterized protein n=1 Tax=Melastoma candidum TaxID=119954 RepID=A0ACB9R7J5_9MYRT|nr:hypothetical protein MLD38_012642 [Melastoma candidum]
MELPIWASDSGGWRRSSYKLEAKNLSYRLPSRLEGLSVTFGGGSDRPEDSKLILKDACCEARSAEITAIAGPSGAGKTTLLEILAGKFLPGRVSGQVLVNDRTVDSRKFRRISGYVSQDDALFPSLTVEEAIMYSALLRLPVGKKDAADRVRTLMKDLGLAQVANARIGSRPDSGISGGEKRRVSIAVELVHDPAVILIDEPTSGLDSGSALHVMKLLKSMAVFQGKTVVLTIHQPGFRILELVDRVILLSGGVSLHNESLLLLEEKLMLSGLQLPSHVNVLEYAIDSIEAWSRRPHNKLLLLQEITRKEVKNSSRNEDNQLFYANSWFTELVILGNRFCSNIFRTKQLFASRVVQTLVAGFVLGTIFLNSGDRMGDIALQTRLGFFAFSLTFLLSSSTEGLPIYLQERRILMRETSRGAYRISSYVMANMLVFLVFLLVVSFLYSAPVYWLVGLRRNADEFLYFSLVVWMVLSMSSSFVSCFSALVPDFIMGTSVISGLMGSFFLFSGYFISKDKIPRYWIFMHYISLFKYPFECFMINEYGGVQGGSKCLELDSDGGCSLTGSGFLRQQGLKESEKWTNLIVMLGFVVGYRILCYLILWYRCYRTRN